MSTSRESLSIRIVYKESLGVEERCISDGDYMT